MPIDPLSFPVEQRPPFGPDQVYSFLTDIVGQGYQVNRTDGRTDEFHVRLTSAYSIRFGVGKGRAQLQLKYMDNMVRFLDVSSVEQMRMAFQGFAKEAGVNLLAPPGAARLKSDTPADNYRSIASLVGTAQITAVFDPFLENKSLAELSIVLSFGQGGFARNVRLLGSEKANQGKTIARFTRAGVEVWAQQHKLTAEARILPGGEHRRFLLLNDGQVLILGMSLNQIHKNEAIRTEPGAQDSAWFDSQWDVAKPLQ